MRQPSIMYNLLHLSTHSNFSVLGHFDIELSLAWNPKTKIRSWTLASFQSVSKFPDYLKFRSSTHFCSVQYLDSLSSISNNTESMEIIYCSLAALLVAVYNSEHRPIVSCNLVLYGVGVVAYPRACSVHNRGPWKVLTRKGDSLGHEDQEELRSVVGCFWDALRSCWRISSRNMKLSNINMTIINWFVSSTRIDLRCVSFTAYIMHGRETLPWESFESQRFPYSILCVHVLSLKIPIWKVTLETLSDLALHWSCNCFTESSTMVRSFWDLGDIVQSIKFSTSPSNLRVYSQSHKERVWSHIICVSRILRTLSLRRRGFTSAVPYCSWLRIFRCTTQTHHVLSNRTIVPIYMERHFLVFHSYKNTVYSVLYFRRESRIL